MQIYHTSCFFEFPVLTVTVSLWPFFNTILLEEWLLTTAHAKNTQYCYWVSSKKHIYVYLYYLEIVVCVLEEKAIYENGKLNFLELIFSKLN